MTDIREKIALLTDKPGVYLMKNSLNKILYVGKAKNLRNRVRSYFANNDSLSPKTRILVKQIADFEYIVTASELEALILECTLIKKHSPRYNILLKDDKSYPYIKITAQDEYPRILQTRRKDNDNAWYFGPFGSVQAVYEIIDMLKQTFKLRTCKSMAVSRPCLRFYINQCMAPCQKYVTKQEYDSVIGHVKLFLEGRNEKLVVDLKKKIAKLASELKFEAAIIYKNQLLAIEKIQQEQKVISQSKVDMDIIGLSAQGDLSCAQVLSVRAGKLSGQNYFYLKNTQETADEDLLNNFIKQYYLQTTSLPNEIVLTKGTVDIELLEECLSLQAGHKVVFTYPKRGLKKDLLNMAEENAKIKMLELYKKQNKEQEERRIALDELAIALNISLKLERIECFDISHNQGQQTVASMTVFINGVPSRKDYKRYKLKTTEGKPDDFLSMQEVISRRYRHGENPPDLIVIDGGKGQLSSVVLILEQLGLQDLAVISLAKRLEEVFVPRNSKPIILSKNHKGLHILQNIRDEAHRFAITYHRKLRNKKNITSILEHIEGVGPTKRAELMNTFKSIDAIKRADLKELMQVKGISEDIAKNIKSFFNKTS